MSGIRYPYFLLCKKDELSEDDDSLDLLSVREESAK
jgi:hypothetical protein